MLFTHPKETLTTYMITPKSELMLVNVHGALRKCSRLLKRKLINHLKQLNKLLNFD